MLLKMIEYLSCQPKNIVIGVCLLLIALSGGIDYLTGYAISVDILYLIPIFFVSVAINKYSGLFIAVISSLVKLFISLLSILPNQNNLFVYWNSFIYLLTVIIIALISSELSESIKREKLISRIDFLTGIPNRKALFESLEIEIYRSRRNHQPLTIAYLDCDNFKAVNDRLGHQAGDALLSVVARTLKSNIRATDLTARLGGDEFVVLLPDTPEDLAFQTVSRLQNMLLTEMQKFNWDVTFSIGIATFNTLPDSIDEIIRTADELMFVVKTTGKGRFEHKIFNQN